MKLWWIVYGSNISLVTSFVHTQRIPLSCSTTPSRVTSTTATHHRDQCRSSRLTPRPEQQGEDAAGGSTSVSDFEQTGDPIKLIVGGLTDLFVRFAGGRDDPLLVDTTASKASLSLQQLEAGIRNEYAKNYLWTGDINESLYEEDCSFTDPTLSFSGLSTYKRNVGSLQGALDLLVTNSSSLLYSCELRQEDSCVQTRWRMVGDLRLPWGPTIDVVGRTTFSYDSGRGNRIFSYDEVWEVEPAEALMQLLKPGRR
ncbi:unnamed protein product [Pylaiella littoralis]